MSEQEKIKNSVPLVRKPFLIIHESLPSNIIFRQIYNNTTYDGKQISSQAPFLVSDENGEWKEVWDL